MHDSLSQAQKDAVFHKEGALLVLAGAGVGKTRVITHRIAELVRQGTAPEHILAVTFTNKAAGEMKERIAHLIGSDWSLSPYEAPAASPTNRTGTRRSTPFVGTFHALSLYIIKSFHTEAGLPARFTIFDRSDSTKVVKKAIKEAGFDPKELEPRRVMSIMGRAKGDALGVTAFREQRAATYIDEAVADVWERYERLVRKEKALDFDDILLTAHTLLKKHAHIREYFQNAWHYLHVDEYQDTNRVQYELIHMLAAKHGNIMAVGDADQNIYSWRGASIDHILNFENDFKDATVLLLTENYRSTKTIIQAANDAIVKNVKRQEKELFTNRPDGELISVHGCINENHEAQTIAAECKRLIKEGRSPNDIAVLYRANFQSRALEEAFLGDDIPYQVLGTRFFERKEIKDALSYLRLAQNPDSTSDLSRIINMPTRGIGKVTLAKVVNGQEESLSAAQQTKVQTFYTIVDAIRARIHTTKTSELVRFALQKSGLWHLYESGKGEDEERLENIKELVSVATKYDILPPEDGLAQLLEEAMLQSDQDELIQEREKKDGVKLMTIHAAKGLEFPIVFISGLEEGLFPHERDESDATDNEEERRLFYVALTRAEEKVYLTHALSRRIFGTQSLSLPSTFITEMDPSLCEIVTTPEESQYKDDDDGMLGNPIFF